jgi:Caspase domain
MRRYLSLAAALVIVATFSIAPAFAEKRVALIIGNSAYRNAPRLANPANDAQAMTLLLKNAAFDVIETRSDLSINEMRRVVRDFSDPARDADMAVVYYAGHGIEVGGNNYLVPIDAALQRDIDVEDETVSLERIMTVIESAKRLRLVILDACRDSPFIKTMKRTMASRAIGRGLAKVEPTTSDTLIAFAARAGSTAADGQGTHSPFTTALLKHLTTPGLDLRIAFGRVRDDVLKSTRNAQEPFVYGSLGGGNISLVSLSPGRIDTDSAIRIPSAEEKAAQDYQLAAQVGTKDAWDAFLAKHPTGFYSDLARAQLAKLTPPNSSAVSATTPDIQPKNPTKLKSAPKAKTANLPPPPKAALPDQRRQKEKSKATVGGGDQMSCCIRYKIRVGSSQAIAAAACTNHIYMQRNYPAQAGVSNWCKL